MKRCWKDGGTRWVISLVLFSIYFLGLEEFLGGGILHGKGGYGGTGWHDVKSQRINNIYIFILLKKMIPGYEECKLEVD